MRKKYEWERLKLTESQTDNIPSINSSSCKSLGIITCNVAFDNICIMQAYIIFHAVESSATAPSSREGEGEASGGSRLWPTWPTSPPPRKRQEGGDGGTASAWTTSKIWKGWRQTIGIKVASLPHSGHSVEVKMADQGTLSPHQPLEPARNSLSTLEPVQRRK